MAYGEVDEFWFLRGIYVVGICSIFLSFLVPRMVYMNKLGLL